MGQTGRLASPNRDPAAARDTGLRQSDGYGINSRLTGALNISHRDRLTQAEGIIRLVAGRFAAYGQRLAIDNGRIIFSGPLANPAIDIRITRWLRREQVTITLELGGFVQDPQIRISSTPPMTEEEALAYLIIGRSLKGLPSGTSRQTLTQALGALGLGYLKAELGLDSTIQASFEEGFLRLGKYLTPELYVGYAVDVFSGAREVVIRYQLLHNLVLEARTGQTQSTNLFYTLESD